MSEAPEKIWYDPQAGFADEKQQYPEDTPYIRADLVDELVEALKTIRREAILNPEHRAIANAALAKVRGEKND